MEKNIQSRDQTVREDALRRAQPIEKVGTGKSRLRALGRLTESFIFALNVSLPQAPGVAMASPIVPEVPLADQATSGKASKTYLPLVLSGIPSTEPVIPPHDISNQSPLPMDNITTPVNEVGELDGKNGEPSLASSDGKERKLYFPAVVLGETCQNFPFRFAGGIVKVATNGLIESVGFVDQGQVVSVNVREKDSAIFVIGGVYYQVRPICGKNGEYILQMNISIDPVGPANETYKYSEISKQTFRITENPVVYVLTSAGPAAVVGAPPELRYKKGQDVETKGLWVGPDGAKYVEVQDRNGQRFVMTSDTFLDPATHVLPDRLRPDGVYGEDKAPGYKNTAVAMDTYLLSELKDNGLSDSDIATIYQVVDQFKRKHPGIPNISFAYKDLNTGDEPIRTIMYADPKTKQIWIDTEAIEGFTLDQIIASIVHELYHIASPSYGDKILNKANVLKLRPNLSIIGYGSSGEPIVKNTETNEIVRPTHINLLSEGINEARTARFLRGNLGWSEDRIKKAESSELYKRARYLVERIFPNGETQVDYRNPLLWMNAVRDKVGGKRAVTGDDWEAVALVFENYAYNVIKDLEQAYKLIEAQFKSSSNIGISDNREQKIGSQMLGKNGVFTTTGFERRGKNRRSGRLS